MARTQRVLLDDSTTWTVVDGDGLPAQPVEEYMTFLRDTESSPNTVKAYATGLAAWWTVLEHTGRTWDEFPSALFGQFLEYLRTGDLPGTKRIGEPEQWLKPSSVQARAAAVLSFYRYQAAANGVEAPYQALYTPYGKKGRSRYKPMLAGVANHGGNDGPRPLYTVRAGPKGRTPILTPTEVKTILNGCAVQTSDGSWAPSVAGLRDRLLFATLAETGMRVGEALSLRHHDFHIGAGGTAWIEVTPRQDHPHGMRVKATTSRRIHVGDDLEALYAAYVWELVDDGIDLTIPDLSSHFVFVNVAAGARFAPMRSETVYARVRALTRRHHDVLPDGWSPHWLRHTHATSLLLAGQPTHVVMRRLGHLDEQTTIGTYGWVTEDAEMRALADWRSYVAGWGALHDQT